MERISPRRYGSTNMEPESSLPKRQVIKRNPTNLTIYMFIIMLSNWLARTKVDCNRKSVTILRAADEWEVPPPKGIRRL